MALKDEIEQLMCEPAQATAFGLAGWTDGAEGVERQASEMDGSSFEAATRQLMLAMIEGQRQAIVRLAEAVEDQDAARR